MTWTGKLRDVKPFPMKCDPETARVRCESFFEGRTHLAVPGGQLQIEAVSREDVYALRVVCDKPRRAPSDEELRFVRDSFFPHDKLVITQAFNPEYEPVDQYRLMWLNEDERIGAHYSAPNFPRNGQIIEAPIEIRDWIVFAKRSLRRWMVVTCRSILGGASFITATVAAEHNEVIDRILAVEEANRRKKGK